jgi:hypothetical protein
MVKKSDRECWRGWPNTLGLNRKTFKGWPKLDFNLVAWSPNTDKGAVASIRKWLEQHGAEPLRRRPVDLNPFLVMEKATFGATS